MIKKIALFLLFFCYCPVALASAWDAFTACFNDFCNCGDSNATIREPWNDEDRDPFKRNRVCAPWNKDGGRDEHTCLLKEPFPGNNIGYYENLCGEETPDSTYFEPKIRVRGQQCNFIACWTSSDTLSWDGQCVTLVGGYVFPLHRMCARVAMPADLDRGFAQDPGYTYGKHLNFEGATKDDDPIVTVDGETIILESPKLCLYKDPAFFSAEDGFDVMDLDPHKQSYHKTAETHPVVRVIIFFIDNISTFAQSPFTLLSSLFGLMDDGEEGETTFGSVMSDIFSFLGKIIEWVGELIIDFLKEIGQINRAVDDKVYGCVNLPMGPFPPPYCESVAPFFQVANTQYICHIGEDGVPIQSTSDKECVVSSLRNNYVHNSIRVGYDNFVPLCANGEDPMTTDKCVVIENLGAFSSASGLHATTARRDIIKPCSTAASGAPCVQSMRQHSCSVSSNGCQDGFRIVYATTVGGVVSAKSYFRDDIDDCPSSTTATCQKIWGINTGEFVDKKVAFAPIQTSYSTSPLTANFTLVDKSSREAYFTASMVRISGFNSQYGFSQEPNQFCVFEGDNVVGCQDRAPAPKPLIYECGGGSVPGITCTSTYFAPKFIVSYNSIYRNSEDPLDTSTDSTAALIEPLSVYNDSGSISTVVNLAGDEFESFVTDDTFNVKPFSGPNSPNPSSIFGVYQNNIMPLVGTTVNQDAVYISGLEYVNGKYHLGGTHACLSSSKTSKCPDNPKLCVLTKLLNKDTVRCSVFASKSATQGGLSLCSSIETTTCPSIDSIARIGGGTVTIRKCTDNKKCYDGTVELCKVSNLVSDRINPAPNSEPYLADSQYYDTSASSGYAGSPGGFAVNYDTDLYGLRDKTAVELGLCIGVPQGTCSEQTNYSEDNGYAYWPSVNSGLTSNGTCRAGWSPVSPLVRRCIPFSDSKTFGLEPLYKIVRNIFGTPSNVYGNIKCKEDE
ncbi:hypothetical protein Megvenef_00378 [Candidatus Megaera venefica]|uniref:Conjugal transfer protein TraN n=1 Tax=Candidatus Megaera venefica TaxID=2055910 RepID=A0ABU5NB87_9RICK|nr:hypothetical protein [Candidatus Megaera venefica]MEA0970416.1 hypothetical protein [Candidatus Megaera venefica]